MNFKENEVFHNEEYEITLKRAKCGMEEGIFTEELFFLVTAIRKNSRFKKGKILKLCDIAMNKSKHFQKYYTEGKLSAIQ